MANNFAKNLKILRKIKGESQAELARIVSKGQTTIGNWETGLSEPNIEELVILSNFFGVSLDALILSNLPYASVEDKVRQVEDDPVPYKTKCAFCNYREDVITSLKGQVDALEKVVVHAEARLNAITAPVEKVK